MQKGDSEQCKAEWINFPAKLKMFTFIYHEDSGKLPLFSYMPLKITLFFVPMTLHNYGMLTTVQLFLDLQTDCS